VAVEIAQLHRACSSRGGHERPPHSLLHRPCIERSVDCPGWYVIQGNHGWLCGSREHALREFNDLVKIERTNFLLTRGIQ
jgi:hypothetical protein